MNMKELLDYYLRLSQHNEKPWFDEHRAEYEASKRKLEDFAEAFIQGVGTFDPRCRGLQPKDCTYRIYRDVRFSADKRPYKDWHGVYVCPQGKKSGRAGYYIHFEPANDHYFVCGGLYNPSREVLQSVREQLSLDSEEFHREVLACGEDFHLNWDNALKRMPRGFCETDLHSEYYRLKSYEIYKPLSRRDVLAPDFLAKALSYLKRCYSLNEWLNRCVDYAYENE